MKYCVVTEIRDWVAFIVGIASLWVSILGMQKAASASKKAEETANAIEQSNSRKALASDWKAELFSVPEDEEHRVYSILELGQRILSDKELPLDNKNNLKTYCRMIESYKDHINKDSMYNRELKAAMSKAVGEIKAIIDIYANWVEKR
ncbi:MAG: hypothetical protein E7104_02485 [Prevotella sp.]|nr:hypothetical protein [Prevotella sp.]